jgi:S-adenosylmethionine hydrolase
MAGKTPQLITLTTDFGTSDHFVGVMKGVILGIAPQVTIIDVSHHVKAFEISEGAFLVSQMYRYYPKGTIHVAVVDPGVGTSRRPLLVEAAGQYFIGPDNGLLSMVYSREKHKAREITARKYFLQPVSATFHGRDIFAPVAAHLASGVKPAQFGNRVEDHLRMTFEHPKRNGKRTWTGVVLKADHFGNLITNFHIDEFPDLPTRAFEMQVGIQKLDQLAHTYAQHDGAGAFIIVGSSGYLEVAVNQGSAAKSLGCGAGSPVELTVY